MTTGGKMSESLKEQVKAGTEAAVLGAAIWARVVAQIDQTKRQVEEASTLGGELLRNIESLDWCEKNPNEAVYVRTNALSCQIPVSARHVIEGLRSEIESKKKRLAEMGFAVE